MVDSNDYEKFTAFKLDATFTEHDRFFQGATAYESVNYPNRFIRHSSLRLSLDPYDAAPLYKKDASFYEIDVL